MNIFIFAKSRREPQLSGQMALTRRMFVNIFRLPFLESGRVRVCECETKIPKQEEVWRLAIEMK